MTTLPGVPVVADADVRRSLRTQIADVPVVADPDADAGRSSRMQIADVPVVSDADARRSLRMQIARLESKLIALPAGPPADPPRRMQRGAVLPSLAELERTRDELVRRIQERRFTAGEQQERKRRLREEMLLNPAAHFGMTVSNAEVGEPGCTRWSTWFRLRISGGCP